MNTKTNLQSGLKNTLINRKIKEYLKSETNFITLLGEHDEDILLGRKELAENLLEQITKWENE